MRAFVAFAAPVQRRVHRGEHVLRQHVGEEAEPAAIDAEQRDTDDARPGARHEACAVAADGDDQVGPLGDLGLPAPVDEFAAMHRAGSPAGKSAGPALPEVRQGMSSHADSATRGAESAY